MQGFQVMSHKAKHNQCRSMASLSSTATVWSGCWIS